MKALHAVAIVFTSAAVLASAADTPAHKMYTAKDLEWKDSPSLPGATTVSKPAFRVSSIGPGPP